MRPGVRAVAGLLLALSFVIGALTGMALEEALGIDWFEFLEEGDEPEEQLLTGLDLSRDQRALVEQILDEREDRLESYWGTRLPEIRGIMTQSYGEMRSVLTPEQRAMFDTRLAGLRNRVDEEVPD
jgi:Spy/CpxP family protein refolding chaperone